MLVVRRTVVESAKALVLELVFFVLGVETESGFRVFGWESGECFEVA